ncbi:hypothetical protein DH2020_016433 [Rehmannia glutinosa]|uniref:Uncharacterized protein n=1 Tax=Rehmannia glutinosa TaxID=99300 RepID=A0ABR0WPS2_REHGL
MGASLPPKEANLFKLIVKSYETKQYKKGLKAADAILKKFPDHGETLSMKGLTLNCMDRKSEAYELVRLGLKNDLKSHVCWHVYGLLYRSDREYREAIKCYRNALRIDPDNIEILRDLSLLQSDSEKQMVKLNRIVQETGLAKIMAQMRDLEGFVETRQQLLTLKPNHRMNWIGFAVAQHLNFKSLTPPAFCLLVRYYTFVLKIHLSESHSYFKPYWLLRARTHEPIGSKAVDILEAYEGTLEDDYPPDNERCEHGEMLLYKISLLEECGLVERALQELHKKDSKIVDKLSYKEQEVSLLEKLGLFDEGEELYKKLLSMNPDNYRYYEGLQRCMGLYKANGQYSSDEIDRLEALYVSLSKQYSRSSAVKVTHAFPFLSSHLRLKCRVHIHIASAMLFYSISLKTSNLRKTGWVPSLFSDLSPLYDHSGKVSRPADILEQLILEMEHSLKETGGYPGRVDKEPPSTLMWTLFYLAQTRHYDVALRKIDEAIEHTPTVIDLYSVKSRILKHAGDSVAAAALADEARCMDLADRSFLSFDYALMFDNFTLDRLHSHSYFRKAAAGAIRCYLKLYDSPSKSSAEEDEEMSKLPPSQKKKLRQKQRKAEARAKKEAEVKEESNATAVSRSGKRQVKPVDLDPHGEKLLQVEDPLVEATKYLKLLQKHSSDSLETHLLSFEVNMRKQKILLALQAVKHLLRLDADDPDTHRCLIKFFTKVGSMPAPVTDAEKLIWGVIEAERPTISQLHGKSLIEANTLFLEKHRDSLRHRAAVAEMMFVMEPKKKKRGYQLARRII